MKNDNLTYSLQGIRIFSAFIVMLYHINFFFIEKLGINSYQSFFNFGNSGVHLFFVLSGYVMYIVHKGDIGKGLSIGKIFAWKRFIRIYPTYWILTTLVLIAMFLIPGEVKSYKSNITYIIQSYSLIELGIMKGLPIITSAWSLFHEIKFYIFFFLFIAIKYKKLRITLFIVLFVFTLLNTFNLNFNDKTIFYSFYFSSLNFLFLLGVFAGWISHKFNYLFKSKFYIIISLLCYVLISVLCNVQSWTPDNPNYILFGIPAFMIITSFTCRETFFIRNNNESPFIIGAPGLFLAEVSYCLYLLHIPIYTVIFILNKKLNFSQFPLISLLLISSVLSAVIYYKLIEYPIVKMLRGLSFKKN